MTINKLTTPELKELNLRKNKIEELHQINLPKMISLNLEGNPIIENDKKMEKIKSLNESKVNKHLKLVMGNKKSSER